MQLVGANRRARVIGENQLAARTNYLIGKDASHWRTGVANYERVRVEQAYRGIDVVYYGSGQQLEYDFKVAPGADFKAIRLRFPRARIVSVDEAGDLIIRTGGGTLRHQKPVAYQLIGGGRNYIPVQYAINSRGEVRFVVGEYDRQLPLVIDPVLSYATYFGSHSGSDFVTSVAFDTAGNTYIAGVTLSADFPTTRGALQPAKSGDGRFDGDIFIAKLNPAGTEVLYATYLGGNSNDACEGMAVDSAGNAYVTGTTFSIDFPTSANAFQRQPADSLGTHLFVAKLNPTGTSLVYSTYLSGRSGYSTVAGIAVDAAGQATIAGDTDAKFQTTPGALQKKRAGFRDAFIARLNGEGSSLVYATYLGGEAEEYTSCLTVDMQGNAYVSGRTLSTDFPTTQHAYQKENKSGDAIFLSKISAAGDRLVYSTFTGGDLLTVTGIAVDPPGNCYLTGYMSSPNLPVTAGAFQTRLAGGSDAFVKKFNDSGSELVYSTFLGGSADDSAAAIAVDSLGQAYITGKSYSADLPSMNSLQPAKHGNALLKSTDTGDNWEDIPLQFQVINSLVVDSNTTATLYASTGTSIIKSTDSGLTWHSILTGFVGLVTIDPVRPQIVYGLGGSNFYKSTDAGANWQHTFFPVSGLTGMVIDPVAPDTLYLSAAVFPSPGNSQSQFPEVTGGFFFRSTDGGLSWTSSNLGPGISSVNCIALDPQNPSTLYAGAQPLLKSTDAGASWFRPSEFLIYAKRLVINPMDSATIYALTFNSVLKSTDGGASWITTGLQQTLGNTGYANGLAIDPKTPSTLYVSDNQGLYRTTDGGESWLSIMRNAYVTNSIVLDPQQPSTIYAPSSSTNDIFVAKLNASGSALIYSTYLGGISEDYASCIAADGYGNAVVGGVTYSGDFPVTANVAQAHGSAQFTGFVIRIADPIALRITDVSIKGKKLFVSGEGFHQGAIIMINGVDLETQNDATTPATLLISKRGGKQIAPGQTVTIRVRDADGKLSDEFSFIRGPD